MKRFKVMLEGANYLLDIDDGEPHKYGFVTHRFVRATTAAAAEDLARRMVCCDPLLARHTINGSGDPPCLRACRIQRVWVRHWFAAPRPGLRLHPEETSPDDQG